MQVYLKCLREGTLNEKSGKIVVEKAQTAAWKEIAFLQEGWLNALTYAVDEKRHVFAGHQQLAFFTSFTIKAFQPEEKKNIFLTLIQKLYVHHLA